MKAAIRSRPRDQPVTESSSHGRKKTLVRGSVRLKVQLATVKTIRRTVKSHRKRILKAQKLRRRFQLDAMSSTHNNGLGCDLPCDADSYRENVIGRGDALRLKKLASTDSDELDVDVCSEEDHEDNGSCGENRFAALEDKERGCEVDSGCDEWDLSKDTLEWTTMTL